MVATVEDGEVTRATARSRQPALARLRVPQGHRDDRGPERSRPRAATAQAHRRPGRVRAGVVGRGAGRHRRPPEGRARRARARVGRLVHGQPRRVLLLAHPVGQGLPGRDRLAALLLGRLAGREQPLRRQRAALRLAAGGPGARPHPHELHADGRGQPAGLARVGAQRAAGARAAARDHRARRADRGGRPATLGDGAPVRAPADPARRRRLAAALAAVHDLRGGARRRARISPSGPRAPRSSSGWRASTRRRRPSRAPACPAERVRDAGARLRRGRRRGGLRPHRLVPRALRDAGRLPARRAERRDREPRPARRRGVRATAGLARRDRARGSAWRATARRAHASATSRT